jgi:hypothetical protein
MNRIDRIKKASILFIERYPVSFEVFGEYQTPSCGGALIYRQYPRAMG